MLNVVAGTAGIAYLFRELGLAVQLGSATAMLSLFVIAAFVRFWFFRFHFDDAGLRIRQGVIRKTSKDIPFERVQAINIRRSLADRAFGLSTVMFDTAGSQAVEAELPGVTEDFVRDLRRRIDDARQEHGHEAPLEAGPDPEGRLLLALSPADMVRIGLTDRSVLVGAAGLVVLGQQYTEAILAFAKDVITQASAEVAQAGLVVAFLVGGALLLLGFGLYLLVMIAVAFFRYYNYQLFEENDVFRSRAGLTTRKEVTVNRLKVQVFQVKQTVLMTFMRRCRLYVLPVGGISAPDANLSAQPLSVPLMAVDEVTPMASRILEDRVDFVLNPASEEFAPVSPVYMRPKLLAYGVLPMLAAVAGLLPFVGAHAWWAVLWLPLVGLLVFRAWRTRGYWHADYGIVGRQGVLGRTLSGGLFRKAQSVEVSQSPLERRHGLGTLVIGLAAGSVSVPYIDWETACRLRDYTLYKVESSQRPWH